METDSDDGFGNWTSKQGVTREVTAATTVRGGQPSTSVFQATLSDLDVRLNQAVNHQLSMSFIANSRDRYKQAWEFKTLELGYDSVSSCLNNMLSMKRSPPPMPVHVLHTPAQTTLRQNAGKSLVYVTKQIPRISWPEAKLVLRDRALARWRIIVEENPQGTLLGRQLHDAILNLASPANIEAIILDTFQDKAQATLAKRASAVLKYMLHSRKTYGVAGIPFMENRIYDYVRSMILGKAAPTAPASFVSALNFAGEILKAEGAFESAASARVRGASQRHFGTKRMLRQALVLRTEWVSILEAAVHDAVDQKDKIASGFFCFLIHARPRFSDAQFSSKLQLDVGPDGFGFIEGGASEVKTATTAKLRTQMMPLVAPDRGVIERSWGVRWCQERELQGIDGFKHLLPMVSMSGEWIDQPCDVGTANRWLKSILIAFGVDASKLIGASTHSCKATSLSWCAKYNLPFISRQLLGHHVPSHLTSAITYSRDSLSGPLREYDEVLAAIRAFKFEPDNSRSGRFTLLTGQADEVPADLPSKEIGKDGSFVWKVREEEGLTFADISDESSGSSESDSTSSDDDDSDVDLAAVNHLQKDRPNAVAVPSDVHLYVCRSSRLLHVRGKRDAPNPDNHISYKLRCGKVLTGSFTEIKHDKLAAYSKCVICFSIFKS